MDKRCDIMDLNNNLLGGTTKCISSGSSSSSSNILTNNHINNINSPGFLPAERPQVTDYMFYQIGSTIDVPQDKNVLDDCIEINKVLSQNKIGIRKKVLVDIFGRRLTYQRIQILQLYERVYRRNLIDKFERKLCGKFGFIVGGLLTDNITFQAQLLYKYIKCKNIDSIIFMICARSSIDIQNIRDQYEKMYSCECVGEIMKIIKDGRLKHLLSLILLESRDENFRYQDYEEFFKENCEKGNESIFVTESAHVINKLLTKSNPSYLNLMFKYYEQSTNSTFEKRVRDLFQGGPYLLALIVTYKFIWNSDMCFCEIFNNLCNNKNHIGIIGFIIEHSEVNLSQIIEIHNIKYKSKFRDRLRCLFEKNSLELLLNLSNDGLPNGHNTLR